MHRKELRVIHKQTQPQDNIRQPSNNPGIKRGNHHFPHPVSIVDTFNQCLRVSKKLRAVTLSKASMTLKGLDSTCPKPQSSSLVSKRIKRHSRTRIILDIHSQGLTNNTDYRLLVVASSTPQRDRQGSSSNNRNSCC